MTVCLLCRQEMLDGVSCSVDTMRLNGKVYPKIRHGDEPHWTPETLGGRACHDCGTPMGGYHHNFCDMERCPRCGEQSIGCDCKEGSRLGKLVGNLILSMPFVRRRLGL